VPRNQVRPRKHTHPHTHTTILLLRWFSRTPNTLVQVSVRPRWDDEGFCLRFHQSNVLLPLPHPAHPPSAAAARTTVLLCQRLLVLSGNGYRMIICNSDFLFTVHATVACPGVEARRCCSGRAAVAVARTLCTKSIMPAAVSPYCYAHKHIIIIYTHWTRWLVVGRVGQCRRSEEKDNNNIIY